MCAQASALSVRACCDDGARHEVDAHEAVLRMWSWYMVRIDQASKTKAWAGRSGKCRWEKKLRDGGNACRAGRPGRLGHRNTHRLLTKSSSWFLASERSSQRLVGGGVRSGRSTGVTGDVTVVPAGSEARAVPTPTQSSHRDRLDARGERLRAGQNKYYLAYAQSLHTEAFWRPSVSSEKP